MKIKKEDQAEKRSTFAPKGGHLATIQTTRAKFGSKRVETSSAASITSDSFDETAAMAARLDWYQEREKESYGRLLVLQDFIKREYEKRNIKHGLNFED